MNPTISPRAAYLLTSGADSGRAVAVGLYLIELPYPPYAEGLMQLVYAIGGDSQRVHLACVRVLRSDSHGLLMEQRTLQDEPIETMRFRPLTRALYEKLSSDDVPGVEEVLALTKRDTAEASDLALSEYYAERTLSPEYFEKFGRMQEIGEDMT